MTRPTVPGFLIVPEMDIVLGRESILEILTGDDPSYGDHSREGEHPVDGDWPSYC